MFVRKLDLELLGIIRQHEHEQTHRPLVPRMPFQAGATVQRAECREDGRIELLDALSDSERPCGAVGTYTRSSLSPFINAIKFKCLTPSLS